MNTFEIPVYVRIIGFSQAMAPTIERIQSLGYDGVSACLYSPEKPYVPTDDDSLVILLSDSATPEFKSIAKTGFDADILTLGVLTSIPADLADNQIDSFTVAQAAEMFDVVKSILDSFILPAQLRFDFYDLRSTLNKTGHFVIASALGSYTAGMKNLIDSADRSLTKEQKESIKNLAVLITGEPESIKKLLMSDLELLTDFIRNLDESIEVIWSINYDSDLDPETLKITFIAAGKNLPL